MHKRLISALLFSVIGLGALLVPTQAERNQVLYRDQVAVLMYHHIHDADTSTSTITSQLFRDQLQFLLSKGYHFISLQEFKQYMDGATVPDNAVLVTFDDGYESVYKNAYPILRELRIPAVNFMITDSLADPKSTYIPSMSAEELARMSRETNFMEVQCHTDGSHRKLPNGEAALVGRDTLDGRSETDAEYRTRISADANACANKLEPLQDLPVDTVAYPYGIINEEGADLFRRAGFNYGFTIIPQMATREADPMRIPRINAGSPWITPERLHTMLKRRTVSRPDAFAAVDLADAASRLGGTVVDDGSSILVRLGDRSLTGNVGSKLFTSGEGNVQLQEPIRREQSVLRINLPDLQKLLGREITYNRRSGYIYWREQPLIRQAQSETPSGP
ncbi:polysaccharide deacetylase family protein [Paenibacillus lutrae]|uniref:Polysaccharide deacetylase family protein n=1 Tax=Paenibacillus lutrae TaxID=2078573 RepID=A0A7X3FJM3_9BACL|nr:polysaccharide deacetylase family protein [Paenibacillus lutrae]MVP00920.1 polysaccharide deacetylase family protein [Paenibacillus lutrae]